MEGVFTLRNFDYCLKYPRPQLHHGLGLDKTHCGILPKDTFAACLGRRCLFTYDASISFHSLCGLANRK